MIATFIIEIFLAFYVAFKHRNDLFNRIVIFILVFLALFQLAEFSICEQLGLRQSFWAMVGFASISALPPLGVHLINTVAKKSAHWSVYAAYGTGLVWMVLFLTQDLFKSFGCGGNYIIFNLQENWGGLFGLYYYFWLLFTVGLAIKYWFAIKSKYRKRALVWSVLGYLSFVVPTMVVTVMRPEAVSGIPSVMCGFAIIFALILVFGAAPNYRKVASRR